MRNEVVSPAPLLLYYSLPPSSAALVGAESSMIFHGHIIDPLFFLLICTISTSLSGASTAHGQCAFQWKPGNDSPTVNGLVYAMTVWDPDGAGPQPPLLVIGGDFTTAGSTMAHNIAAWNGNSWSALGTGVG